MEWDCTPLIPSAPRVDSPFFLPQKVAEEGALPQAEFGVGQ